MKLTRLLPFFAISILIISCFLPWIVLGDRNISFRGIDEIKLITEDGVEQVNWGRPAYFHFVWAGIFFLLLFIKKKWSIWGMLIASALNVAWAFRNFLLLPACGGGECPIKQIGLYLLLVASVFMFVALLVRKI